MSRSVQAVSQQKACARERRWKRLLTCTGFSGGERKDLRPSGPERHPACVGRVSTALNMTIFVAAFLLQWIVGVVLAHLIDRKRLAPGDRPPAGPGLPSRARDGSIGLAALENDARGNLACDRAAPVPWGRSMEAPGFTQHGRGISSQGSGKVTGHARQRCRHGHATGIEARRRRRAAAPFTKARSAGVAQLTPQAWP